MINLLFALLSLALLIPVLLFLPLGLSIKGKLFLAFLATIFALLGMWGLGTFSMNRMALMLPAAILASAYLLDQRAGHILYIKSEFNSKKFKEESLAHESYIENRPGFETLQAPITEAVPDGIIEVDEIAPFFAPVEIEPGAQELAEITEISVDNGLLELDGLEDTAVSEGEPPSQPNGLEALPLSFLDEIEMFEGNQLSADVSNLLPEFIAEKKPEQEVRMHEPIELEPFSGFEDNVLELDGGESLFAFLEAAAAVSEDEDKMPSGSKIG